MAFAHERSGSATAGSYRTIESQDDKGCNLRRAGWPAEGEDGFGIDR